MRLPCLLWLVLNYFLQSMGELFLAPIGLSMITTLSPRTMVGLMIGVWYTATAMANIVAGFAAKLTTLPSIYNDSAMIFSLYSKTFFQLGGIALILGISILVFSPKLTRIIKT